ncbi:flavorubredoxin [Hydrogenoanaerobacterium saccharovorans]|uniref:Flavorubredoxin n=1 Tax=Hydrogenoanaerobacterium saccharovorans TaxID=474960 RepID=A0A1H7ZLA3_9FIRM|nr:FprA family A-type flavoprotein [Hydrogenoanaerobacterium saccharovorans]RPF48571.1 flavorubredoxin [Hydrogenoanaerobacterium saccharovorans]SEM58269.1 Flavorubredoxin [Hydrogenoanaerobacterium saccharovorans]
MSSRKVTENIYSVGILNPIMRIFDVVMTTDYGTTYNSFIIKGSEKTALIDTCHLTYWEQYLKNIEEVCDPSKIDYIILNHCEPDHSGALANLAKHCPNAEIVASQAGSIYLKNITNIPDFKARVVKDGDTLDLGGKELKFISAPFLHWPDSMFTWCEQEKTLFSCDFLGCHYCEPHDFDYNIAYPAKYEDAFQYYYKGIFGPFPTYVQNGLNKIKDLDIEYVCNSHGPILTKGCRLDYTRKMYNEWSQPRKNPVTTVPIFYCSAYGNTGLAAEAIKTGINEVIPDANVTIYDINNHNMAELQSALNSSDAFAIGSPTINADAVAPVWNLLSHVDAINNKKKPALAFGSYGWSGEAVPNIIARMQGLKLKVYEEGFKFQFVPSESDIEKATEIGREFAKTI